MAYCTNCGGEISQGDSYCQHCGTSLANASVNIDPIAQPTQKGDGSRMTFIGCLGLILKLIGLFLILCMLLFIVAFISYLGDNDNSTEEIVSDETNRVGTTAGLPSRTPTAAPALAPISTTTPRPTPISTATSTPTPIPTATSTPTPLPIQMELTKLLDEYDQNKVRANTRLRYQENGKAPLSTSGYVSEVEELYVSLAPTQEQDWWYEGLDCYYADTRAALHLTKGQLVSVIGRVSGTDEYTDQITMFGCEIEGIEFEKKPTVSAQKLRRNTVQIYCISDSIFSDDYQGTGVIIDAREGFVLTVHHLVADENECKTIEVYVQGIEDNLTATSIKHCASIDRALLRISPQSLSALFLERIYRAAAPAQVDQEIFFWGYGPGRVMYPNARMETGIVKDTLWGDITTDAYAVPGDSGSPVFDENGHLLGTMSRSNRSDRAVFTGDEC